jgi:hypothetical protein
MSAQWTVQGMKLVMSGLSRTGSPMQVIAGGNSQSFIEGCESYAEEYGSPDEEEYFDDEEPEESEYE